MELIDRYVQAVGRHIWNKQRADIEQELKSILLDMLDERRQGQEATRDEIVSLLKEYGTPAQVAATYNENNYVVGPELFELYIMVLKIVALAVGIGLTVAYGVDLIAHSDQVRQIWPVLAIIPQFASAMIYAVGIVTLIFFMLQYFLKKEDLKEMHPEEEWDPEKLPQKIMDKDRVSLPGLITSCVFILIALAIFNLGDFSTGILHRGEVDIFLLVNPDAIDRYLPYWNGLWVATLILNLLLIFHRAWSWPSRLLQMAIWVFSIGVLALMIAGPEMVSAAQFNTLEMDEAAAATLSGLLGKILDMAFLVGIIGTVADMIKSIYKALKQ